MTTTDGLLDRERARIPAMVVRVAAGGLPNCDPEVWPDFWAALGQAGQDQWRANWAAHEQRSR